MINRKKIHLKAGIEETIELPKTITGTKTYCQIEFDFKGTHKRLNFTAKGLETYFKPVHLNQPINKFYLHNPDLGNEISNEFNTIILKSDEDLHIAFSLIED